MPVRLRRLLGTGRGQPRACCAGPAAPRRGTGWNSLSVSSGKPRDDPGLARALAEVAGALGRGMGSLVNAHDPEAIGLSGLGRDIYQAAPDAVRAGYTSTLMRFRRDAPPPLIPSRLGGLGVLTGAAELVFDAFLTPRGLLASARGRHPGRRPASASVPPWQRGQCRAARRAGARSSMRGKSDDSGGTSLVSSRFLRQPAPEGVPACPRSARRQENRPIPATPPGCRRPPRRAFLPARVPGVPPAHARGRPVAQGAGRRSGLRGVPQGGAVPPRRSPQGSP